MIELIAYIVGGFIGGWLLAIVAWFAWMTVTAVVTAIWQKLTRWMTKPLNPQWLWLVLVIILLSGMIDE